jgi:hypothetical protein
MLRAAATSQDPRRLWIIRRGMEVEADRYEMYADRLQKAGRFTTMVQSVRKRWFVRVHPRGCSDARLLSPREAPTRGALGRERSSGLMARSSVGLRSSLVSCAAYDRDMKRALARPAIQWAIGLVLLAGAVLVAWLAADADWFDDWIANVVVGLVSVAVTITLVEWIVQQEAKRRFEPRVERALRAVGSSYRMMVRVLALDYKATHNETFRRIDTTSLGVLGLWDTGVDTEDTDRTLNNDGLPHVVNYALTTADQLQEIRETERDVLEPDVVAAIDAFKEDARMAVAIYIGMEDADQRDRERHAIAEVVGGTRRLGEALIGQDRQWLDEGLVAWTRLCSWSTEPDPTQTLRE